LRALSRLFGWLLAKAQRRAADASEIGGEVLWQRTA
jgi:hypothetical protein